MEFDYLTEKSRMCRSNEFCADCYFHGGCIRSEKYNPEEARSIVKAWSEENPMETNFDHLVGVLIDVFDKEIIGYDEHTDNIRIKLSGTVDWWFSEYKGASDD